MMSLSRPPRALALALVLGAAAQVAAPLEAHAQPAQDQPVSQQQIQLARQAASEGLTAYRAGEFDKALNLFEQAKALYPSAQIIRMIGYSLLALERWQPAAEAMEASLESKISALGEDDRKDVQEQLGKAMSHIGVVTVTTPTPGAKLAIDDQPPINLPLAKPLRVAPGKHKLRITAPEHQDEVQEVDLEGGKPLELSVELQPIKKEQEKPPSLPPPPPKKKTWFSHQRQIGLGVAAGGAGLGLSAIATGFMSLHLANNAQRDAKIHEAVYGTNCSRGDLRYCNLDRQVITADARDANVLRTWTIGLGIGAGLLVGAGVVFVVFGEEGEDATKPKDDSPRPVSVSTTLRSLSCGPLGAGLSCAGTF